MCLTRIYMQNDPCTNAGRGSNLTEDGHVECDASVMDGNSGAFGAVGAVPGISQKASTHVFLKTCFLCFHDFLVLRLLFSCMFYVYLKRMTTRCKKCHKDCCFAGQGADVGLISAGSNSSHVNFSFTFVFKFSK